MCLLFGLLLPTDSVIIEYTLEEKHKERIFILRDQYEVVHPIGPDPLRPIDILLDQDLLKKG